MARVTVEDCISVVSNRFELVLYASERSRAISRGSEITVERDDDKDPVVALREIADNKLDIGVLQEGIVRSLQKHFEREDSDEDPVEAYARSLGLDQIPEDPEADILSASDLEEASGVDAAGAGIRIADSAEDLNAEDPAAAEDDAEVGQEDESDGEPDVDAGPDESEFEDDGEG